MFVPIALALALCVPLTTAADAGLQVVAAPSGQSMIVLAEAIAEDEHGAPVKVVAKALADGNPAAGAYFIQDGNATPVVFREIREAAPQTWIGIRVTPIPAPLAAHIGDGGVMVGNVYLTSPADEAGVQQYDVIVGFNGSEIVETGDLTEAIAAHGADQPATLTLIRQAREQEVSITPRERPAELAAELKYEEPADDLVDAAINFRGKALELGPGGNWIMKDLGDLKGLPDALDKLKQFNIQIDPDHHLRFFQQFGDDDVTFDFAHPSAQGFAWHGDAGGDEKIEIRIRTEDDGRTLELTTEPDGKIHVLRIDPDGNESSATYETREELEAADPEAAEILGRHDTHGMPNVFMMKPHGDKMQKLQKEYQIDVQRKIEEALQHFRDARGDVHRQHQDAVDQAREALQRARIRVHQHTSDDDAGTSESLMVFEGDDGHIKVTVIENGAKEVYEFESRADFEATQPELYERLRSWLE